MTALKSVRTLAASLGVLAIGAMAASPAMAFDKVDWDWTKDVYEHVYIDVDIDVDVESTGLVEIEKLQIFLGNVKAESKIEHVYNDQYDRDNYFDSPFYNGHYLVPGAYYIHCYADCDLDEVAFDAKVDLAWVSSAATAVGNNQSITSSVPVFLHDGQFLANTNENGYGREYYGDDLITLLLAGAAYTGNDDNLHTALALAMTVASAGGLLDPASINAYSSVKYITNARVDSSATAVGNNLNVVLESGVDGLGTGEAPVKTCSYVYGHNVCDTTTRLSNQVLIGDITQFAYANISATSHVSNITLNEYKNLGDIKDVDGNLVPTVSSVATAVGNNVNISVGGVPVAP
jgi:hypothetical protein